MRKLILLISCLFLFLLVMPSCENEVEHVHSYDKTIVLKAPTCVDSGLNRTVCSCGEEKLVTVKALGHSFDESETCTICKNTRLVIESAEARIGMKFYSSFKDAVNAAMALEDKSARVVELLVSEVGSYPAHSPEINGPIVINANGADFNNQDVAIFTYRNSSNVYEGEVDIVINDARNLYLWGQPDALISDDTVINITLNNCNNTGIPSINSIGRMLYLTGVKGITNVEVNNCMVEKTESPFYTNNSGIIKFAGCTFKDCSVPLNFNMKASGGEKTIIVEDCIFEGCGTTAEENASIAKYSAPIRVVTSVGEARSSLVVEDTSIKNTKGDNGDILLAIKDSSCFKVDATIKDNKTDLYVRDSFDGSLPIQVKAGETMTF